MPSNVLPFKDLQKEYQRLFEKELNIIDFKISNTEWEDFVLVEQELDRFLAKVIVSTNDVDLSLLINKLGNARWVSEGRVFLDNSENKCPFCQQELVEKEELIRKLNLVFDKSYSDDIKFIQDSKENYISFFLSIKNVLEQMLSIEFLSVDAKDLISKMEKIKGENVKLIDKKLSNPNERYSLSSCQDCFALVKKINMKIEQNNNDANNLEVLQNKFKDECWNYMLSEVIDDLTEYENKVEKASRIELGFNSRLEGINKKIEESRQQITPLRTQTINTSTAIDNINSILKSSGFTDFMIEELSDIAKENSNISRYRLKREK